MDNTEQIQQIIADFKKIARLQKSELESTEEMPNYNSSFTQLLKLKHKLKNHKSPSDIKERAQKLLATLSEMSEELPKMIASQNQDKALEIYEKIRLSLKSMIDNLSIHSDETKSNEAEESKSNKGASFS